MKKEKRQKETNKQTKKTNEDLHVDIRKNEDFLVYCIIFLWNLKIII